MKNNKGFTLIELLIVITIIPILALVVFLSLIGVEKRVYAVRNKVEAKSISQALDLYFMDNNYQYPCDTNRDMPPGIEKYLSTNPAWPKAPWPGSVYDWDYWVQDPNTTPWKDENDHSKGRCAGILLYSPNTEPVYQLSIRFCDINGLNCNFPDEIWAQGFDSKSSVYWCKKGPCRAHGSEAYDHAGCCMGGNCPSNQPLCGF